MYNDEEKQRQNDEEYMRNLYLRFRSEVESGGKVEYFDLPELLDIYDYAQDEGDAFVQMFALIEANRLFPEAHEFDERMAFFLSYISADAAQDMFSRRGRVDSPLWDVLAMGVKCFPDKDPSDDLKAIFAKHRKFDCETSLKIIDFLRDTDRHDLLVEFYPQLKEHAEDPRGIAFEVADVLKERDATLPAARNIADELTSLEPFNIEAWLLLARMEFTLDHPAEALAAAEYALAIDPGHANAVLTRAVIMVVMDDRRDEAIGILEKILSDDPLNPFACEGLAEGYARAGRIEDACRMLATIIRENIAISSDPLLALVNLEPDNLEEYLKEYIDLKHPTEEQWRDKVVDVLQKGKPQLAARMVNFYQEQVGFGALVDFYLHTLFDAGEYARFAQVFEQITTDNTHPAAAGGYFSLSDYLLLAVSYMRSGQRDKAALLADAIEKRRDTLPSVDDLLRYRGIILTARLIQSMCASDQLTDDELSRLDPLNTEIF